MRRSVTLIFFVALVVTAALGLSRFMADNADPQRLRFMMWQTREVTLGMLVMLSFLMGLGCSCLFLMSVMIKKALEARRLRRENVALQKLLEAAKPAERSVVTAEQEA